MEKERAGREAPERMAINVMTMVRSAVRKTARKRGRQEGKGQEVRQGSRKGHEVRQVGKGKKRDSEERVESGGAKKGKGG